MIIVYGGVGAMGVLAYLSIMSDEYRAAMGASNRAMEKKVEEREAELKSREDGSDEVEIVGEVVG